MISQAASTTVRNWFAEDYAAIADQAFQRYGMRVLLCGGPDPLEKELGAEIEKHAKIFRPLNLIGKDTVKRLLALMERSTVLLSPDSGPVHMAAITDTPVIGLYAVSNSRRCGPYKSLAYCADAHEQASCRYLGHTPQVLRWGQRVEHPGAMRCVTRELVEGRLDAVMRDAADRSRQCLSSSRPGGSIISESA
ncbi:MAG: glycosyltransferase family 9 protein [Gammaproteobacteria bacterium]|nr:glycosyltransferase family 9 protein [Gammaproteobacteria bacterium]